MFRPLPHLLRHSVQHSSFHDPTVPTSPSAAWSKGLILTFDLFKVATDGSLDCLRVDAVLRPDTVVLLATFYFTFLMTA